VSVGVADLEFAAEYSFVLDHIDNGLIGGPPMICGEDFNFMTVMVEAKSAPSVGIAHYFAD